MTILTSKGFTLRGRGQGWMGGRVVHVQCGPFDDRNGDRQKPILSIKIPIKNIKGAAHKNSDVNSTFKRSSFLFYYFFNFYFYFFCLSNRKCERWVGPLDEIVIVLWQIQRHNATSYYDVMTSFDSRDALPRRWLLHYFWRISTRRFFFL